MVRAILRAALVAAALSAASIWATAARAEPYLAVRTGLKCVSCHVNPSGGGMRNAFGNTYARNELAARVVGDAAAASWTGQINPFISVGADVRAGLDFVDTPERRSEFGVSRANVYAAATAIPQLLTIYLDQHVTPGDSRAREVYALLTPANGRFTVKAGRFFLPFGWRLQDDAAFVRSITGVSFDTPDDGVEAGLEVERWSAQLAVTNGSAGGGEDDAAKQVSLRASYVLPRWQIGASLNDNNRSNDREMVGVFAGLRTGPIAWLAEMDRITDHTPTGENDIDVSLLEGNWLLRKGHNLKLTYEFHDPADDVDEDERERYSLVWEHSPMQWLQSRIGVRIYNGVPSDEASNRHEAFAELHVFF